MKKNPCGGPENDPHLQNKITTQVETDEGVEEVHVDMETGAVTYGSPLKGEGSKAQDEAINKTGSEV